MARRFRLTLVTELLLLLLFTAMLLLWRRLRQRTSRLHGELRAKGCSDRRGETRLHAEQALSIGVLLLNGVHAFLGYCRYHRRLSAVFRMQELSNQEYEQIRQARHRDGPASS